MKTLSNHEMEEMLSKRSKKYYNGFYMRDEKKTPPKRGYYILNMDDESGMGTHWVAVIVTNKKKANLYFDPFGLHPSDEILKWLSPADVIYSTSEIQDRKSSSCGWFVILLLDYLTKHKRKRSMQDNLYNFVTSYFKDRDVKNNEKLLEMRMSGLMGWSSLLDHHTARSDGSLIS